MFLSIDFLCPKFIYPRFSLSLSFFWIELDSKGKSFVGSFIMEKDVDILRSDLLYKTPGYVINAITNTIIHY